MLPLYLTAHVGLGIVAYRFMDGHGVGALVRIAGGPAVTGRAAKWAAAAGLQLSPRGPAAMLPAQGSVAITTVITADRLGKACGPRPRTR